MIVMMYQWIIIGAGPGGYEAAIRAAQLGQKVLLIEQKQVGVPALIRAVSPPKPCSIALKAIRPWPILMKLA